MSYWSKTSDKPSAQTFELPPYPSTVVQNEPDMSEAQRQLQHAKEQLDLAGQYLGRDSSWPLWPKDVLINSALGSKIRRQ
jgi:hypothetical protein